MLFRSMRGGHLTGSPRRLGNSRYLCAQRTAGVDGVKALTLREAPEPRPRGTGRFAGAHKTGKRIGRDTSTRLPMMPFRADRERAAVREPQPFSELSPCRSTKERPRPESCAAPTMSRACADSAGPPRHARR